MRPWKRRLFKALAATLVLCCYIPITDGQEDEDPPVLDFEIDEGPDLGSSEEELSTWLSQRIERAISAHQILKASSIGVMVQDLASGETLYSKNAHKGFNVASNAKIVTAVAALSLLGPDFRFATTLSAKNVRPDGTIAGDLYVRSQADPTLTTWDLHRLADELAIAGVTSVSGDIVVDETYFDSDRTPPHFDEQPKEQAGFRAPVGATSLNFNTVVVSVTPNPGGTGPAKIIVEPKNDYVIVSSRVLTVASGRTRLRVKTKTKKNRLEVAVRGQIRREIRKKSYRLRVPHPAPYLGSTLKKMLAAKGIRVRGHKVRSGATPDRVRVLATRESPSLAEIVRGLGKYSNNYVAEMLLKTIGAEGLGSTNRPATWKDGLDSVRAFLKETVGVTGDFYYGNGSGLFESNKFSPTQMVAVLARAYRDFRIGPDFVSSLSIAGADGTLRRRMLDRAAERLVRAKTGTLDHVSALSGYVAIDARRPVVFSVFVNDIPKWRTADARSLQDAIATSISQYLRRAQ